MRIPTVVHPKKISISGMLFEVVSYSALTDEQAEKVAIIFYRTHKFSKKDKGKLFRVLTQFDEGENPTGRI